MHYAIQVLNEETGLYEWYDPTEGKGKDEDNIVDPQKWIENKNKKQNKNTTKKGRGAAYYQKRPDENSSAEEKLDWRMILYFLFNDPMSLIKPSPPDYE